MTDTENTDSRRTDTEKRLTPGEAAAFMGVSEATVRNWVKTGLITVYPDGRMEKGALLRAGRESGKLRSRANKSRKSLHNHEALTQSIAERLEHEGFDESVIRYYEGSLSESYRNSEGIYYTPAEIVDSMMSDLEITPSTTFLDPCCGTGNFIMGALRKGVKVDNIYGFDSDPNAVAITRERIRAATGEEPRHIICGDFLAIAGEMEERFHLIFTNPPWGKKLKKNVREEFAVRYGCGESSDTTSLFMFASLGLLKPGGKLGFLIQEATLNVGSFESLRRRLLQTRMLEIRDCGKPFAKVMTKAYSLILENSLAKPEHRVTCIGARSFKREQVSFESNPKHIFNVWTTHEEQQVIKRLFEMDHKLLKDNALWGLGIVTGDNSNRCSASPRQGWQPVYRGKDIRPDGIGTPQMYITPDLSECQQVAPRHIYEAPEKLIYRFISSRLVFYCDTEKRLVLNSANIVIPEASLGISGPRIASMLNSHILNWLFSKIFNTHKVLRGDLETLPLFTRHFCGDDFDEQSLLTTASIVPHRGSYRIAAL